MKTGQNFELVRGDHKEIEFSTDSVDFNSVAEIKWFVSDIEKTKSDMMVSSDNVTFDLESTESRSIKPGDHNHELKVKDSDGNVSTIARGTMTILGTSFSMQE